MAVPPVDVNQTAAAVGATRREDGAMAATEPTVTIEVPSDVRFFRSVRLAVGGLAAMVGFDVEAIDDLRIGVDELCATAAEGGDGSPLRLSIVARPGELLRIEATTASGPTAIDGDRLHFSRQILSVISDDYGIEAVGSEVRCWLERAPGGTDDASSPT